MGYSNTDTFASLIDEVVTSLQGYGTSNDQVTTLVSDLSANATQIPTDDSDNVSRGLIEIDDEIIYVTAAENGIITIPPWGRGFKGTAPSTHTAGSPIWIAPTWPRATVAREVNQTIRSVFPDLFAVRTLDITSTTSSTYELPVEVERVLGVEWQWSNAANWWSTITGWETMHSAPVEFTTGKALLIGDALPAGARLHITYAAMPTMLTSASQAFTQCGLPASAHDVIVLGTAARLTPWQDTSRLPVETVPSDAQDQTKPVGLATQVAQSLKASYTLRLAQERRALLDRYPTRSHRTR